MPQTIIMTMVCVKPAFSNAHGIVNKLLPITQFHIDKIVVNELFGPPRTFDFELLCNLLVLC